MRLFVFALANSRAGTTRSPHENIAAVADEVDVQEIVKVRRNERTDELVRFFIRHVRGVPA